MKQTLHDSIKLCERHIKFLKSKLDIEKNPHKIAIIEIKIMETESKQRDYQIILNTIKMEIKSIE